MEFRSNTYVLMIAVYFYYHKKGPIRKSATLLVLELKVIKYFVQK